MTKGTLVMMIGTLGFVAESFVARVLLIRTLSVDQWSQFFIGLTLVGLLSSVGTLGLASAIPRSLPFETDPKEQRRIVRTSFLVLIPSAITLSGVLALLSLPIRTTFESPLLGETLLFFSAAVGLAIIGALIASIFQGFEDVLPNALFVQVINPTLFIVFLLIAEGLGPLQAAYSSALAAYLVSGIVTMGLLIVYARRRLPRLLPPGPREPGLSTHLLRFAVPLFAVGALGFVAGNGDALVLATWDRTSVAYYSADLSLARLLQVGLGSLAYIILPVTARFVRRGDTDSVRTTYTTATKWMVLTSLPLFLLFFFYPSHSLAFVYGPLYTGTVVPLQIVILGAFFSTVVGPATAAQVAFGQTRLLVYNTLAAALVNLLLSLWLIPPYGITGAAIAWAAATALYPSLSMVELAYLAHVHPFERHYLLPVLATGVPVALLLGLLPLAPPLWLLPAIALGIAGFYVLVVLSTRSLDEGDLLLLDAVERLVGRRFTILRRIGAKFLPPSERPRGTLLQGDPPLP
ncbi:MAG TPA: polysaccharide biosynthesis C-terminal domain-containing protein [Thermoplasmata archaeon]